MEKHERVHTGATRVARTRDNYIMRVVTCGKYEEDATCRPGGGLVRHTASYRKLPESI